MVTKKRTSADALADAAKAQADAKQLEKSEYESYGRKLVRLTAAGGRGAPERIALSLAKVEEALEPASKRVEGPVTVPGERLGTVSPEKPGTVGAHQALTVPAQAGPLDSAPAVFEDGAGQGSRP